jgi:hypothetical protein
MHLPSYSRQPSPRMHRNLIPLTKEAYEAKMKEVESRKKTGADAASEQPGQAFGDLFKTGKVYGQRVRRGYPLQHCLRRLSVGSPDLGTGN